MAVIWRALAVLAALGALQSGSVSFHLDRFATYDPVSASSEMSSLAVVAATPLDDDDDHHHGMWGDWDGWGWWVGMPMMVVFWVGLIWLIIWLARRASDGGDGSRYNDPVEIARRRYARGEISREEFDQIRRDLRE